MSRILWMEGGTIDHLQCILDGNPLYVRPSLEFMPFTYTPLYYYASAGMARVLGVGFSAARLVPILSSIGAFVCIGLIVRQQTRSWSGAALAAGLFAATFRISGSWFDLARVDSLFLFLTLCGVWLLGRHSSRRSLAIAGFLFGPPFLTKQTALFILPFLPVGVLLERRWHALGAIGLTGGSPHPPEPSKEDRAASAALITVIAGIDGEVYMPSHGHLTTLAGKEPLAHAAAVEDLYRGDALGHGVRVNTEIAEAIRTQRFQALILDGWWFAEIMEHYGLSSRVFEGGDLFWPVTGKRTRPELILTPLRREPPPNHR